MGRGISCSVASTNALKPGKYRSTSSVVPSLFTCSWSFFGSGTHSLYQIGSRYLMSLQTLDRSRSKRNCVRASVMYNR